MSTQIITKTVNELPEYIRENSDEYWSYPIEELPYLHEQIKDGFRDNNSIMILFENRLYETNESE